MPVTLQQKFGSYEYAAGNADVERWDDQLQHAPVVVPIARSDRGRDADGYVKPRTVNVGGTIGSTDWTSRDELRAALDAFLYAHRPGRRDLYRDSDRKLKNAQVEEVRIKDEGLPWAGYEVKFICADPYWYAASASGDTWSSPAHGNTRDLANDGAAAALPVFTVTAAADGDLSLTLANTGTGLSFTITALPVTNGQELVVDCDAQTVTLDGDHCMNRFSGVFFPLEPGTNTLQLTLSGVTLISIGSAWTKRWL